MSRCAAVAFLTLVLRAAWPAAAAASALPLDPSLFPDPNSLLTPSIRNAIIKTVGFAADHRPYEPATPLGTKIGLDLGIEASLVKIPDDFFTALSEAGLGGQDSITFLPVPRFHLHKGLGERAGFGLSAIVYQGFRVYGADFKVVFLKPEEGPTAAFRICYAQASVQVVSTKTYTPQLLISRALDFADPYLGVGYQYARGTVTISQEILGQTITATGDGTARGLMAFTGVSFRIPAIGFNIVLEGTYATAGTQLLGTKFGFSF
jgi:hypothetical protein